MVKLELDNITKYYGKRRGVENINLSIEDGEYLAVLGPTGSGKTTTMYLVAGLLSPSEGKILFNGEDVTKVPSEDRNVGFVFEEYNLFPRINAESNVLFGPIVKGLDLSDSRQVAREMFSLLNIAGKEMNFPDEISGGQKQRVALARAIVSNANLLVMDDPLRALDAKIREILQVELRNLVKDLSLTCIHATHDTQEAMRVADKIAVFKDGAIVQFGTPEEVYNNPVSIYVANFLGETTELEGTILQEKGQSFLILEDIKIEIVTDLKSGTKAVALIPAELADIHSLSERERLNYDNIIEAEIISTKCVGEFFDVDLIAFNQEIKAKELIGNDVPLTEGNKVLFATDKGDFRVFPIEEDEKNEKEI
jgi:putative spermidine/putrescine transport system ATP-binding protein